MSPSTPPPRISVGTAVTSSRSSHGRADSIGLVTEITGQWARVRWEAPGEPETLEWLPTLRPVGTPPAGIRE